MFIRSKSTFAPIVCATLALATIARGDHITHWTSSDDGNWNALLNWSIGVPTDELNAKHRNELSRIDVNITNAECASFEGKGVAGNDRFMLIKSGMKLGVSVDRHRGVVVNRYGDTVVGNLEVSLDG